ncbi:hypothetical protein LZ30DRAFT_777229 [Colletotrichum cereale]|nr:hypothetical protein LZ30DRAFT_777229 [Colletotrichum cereale]
MRMHRAASPISSRPMPPCRKFAVPTKSDAPELRSIKPSGHDAASTEFDDEELEPRRIRRESAGLAMYDDIISGTPAEEITPYCIWPEITSRETYREIVPSLPQNATTGRSG